MGVGLFQKRRYDVRCAGCGRGYLRNGRTEMGPGAFWLMRLRADETLVVYCWRCQPLVNLPAKLIGYVLLANEQANRAAEQREWLERFGAPSDASR